MGLFSKKQQVKEQSLTLDEQSENMKAIAIEYITSLSKGDKERFFEGADLIWQGYNNSVDKVLTRHQRALRRNNNEDSDISTFFLDDEPTSKPSIAATPPPAPVEAPKPLEMTTTPAETPKTSPATQIDVKDAK